MTRFIVATVPSNCPDAEHLQPSLEVGGGGSAGPGLGNQGLKDKIGVPRALPREEARWAADLPSKQGTGARTVCPHPGRAGKRDPR